MRLDYLVETQHHPSWRRCLRGLILRILYNAEMDLMYYRSCYLSPLNPWTLWTPLWGPSRPLFTSLLYSRLRLFSITGSANVYLCKFFVLFLLMRVLITYLWKCSRTIAIHLFDRLGDEELTNRVEASALFSKLGMATPVVLVKRFRFIVLNRWLRSLFSIIYSGWCSSTINKTWRNKYN